MGDKPTDKSRRLTQEAKKAIEIMVPLQKNYERDLLK